MPAPVKSLRIFIVLCALAVLSGCGAMRLDGADGQTRAVTVLSDGSKTVTFRQGMVWCVDAAGRLCARLPEGTYTLEAQDADFWYFRAPTAIDFRALTKPAPDNQRLIPGGLALTKSFGKAVALMVIGEIYIDAGDGKKMLVQKLGSDFGSLEGSKWVKNFE